MDVIFNRIVALSDYRNVQEFCIIYKLTLIKLVLCFYVSLCLFDSNFLTKNVKCLIRENVALETNVPIKDQIIYNSSLANGCLTIETYQTFHAIPQSKYRMESYNISCCSIHYSYQDVFVRFALGVIVMTLKWVSTIDKIKAPWLHFQKGSTKCIPLSGTIK